MSEPAIQLLPEHVINCIAAGEVVERPASVIKELLENAIDAQANRLEILLLGGGLERMRVSDNGVGISKEDLHLSVMRHATSKIKTLEDIAMVKSLGFRGEALASIAAVSELTIAAKSKGTAVGNFLAMHFGALVDAGVMNCEEGTTVDVKHLFLKFPARRKFMRSPATEQQYCVQSVLRTIVPLQDVGVILESSSRRIIDIPVDLPQIQRIAQVLHCSAQSLRLVCEQWDDCELTIYLAPSDQVRQDNRGIWTFVNRRYVRDRMLLRAVQEPFQTHWGFGKYPSAVVFLTIDPTAIDVNVHPQKLEIRFLESNKIFRRVYDALAKFTEKLQTDDTNQSLWGPGSTLQRREHVQAALAQFYEKNQNVEVEFFAQKHAIENAHERSLETAGGYFTSLKPIGILWSKIGFAERDLEVVLLDLVVIKKLCLKETFLQTFARNKLVCEPLILPVIFESTPSQIQAIERQENTLCTLGAEIKIVGPTRFIVTTFLSGFSEQDIRRWFSWFFVAAANAKETLTHRQYQEIFLKVLEESQYEVEWQNLPEILQQLDALQLRARCFETGACVLVPKEKFEKLFFVRSTAA